MYRRGLMVLFMWITVTASAGADCTRPETKEEWSRCYPVAAALDRQGGRVPGQGELVLGDCDDYTHHPYEDFSSHQTCLLEPNDVDRDGPDSGRSDYCYNTVGNTYQRIACSSLSSATVRCGGTVVSYVTCRVPNGGTATVFAGQSVARCTDGPNSAECYCSRSGSDSTLTGQGSCSRTSYAPLDLINCPSN